jgi:hypothetical protein
MNADAATPEEAAEYFRAQREEFRQVEPDPFRCSCRTKDPQTLAAFYVHEPTGRGLVWVAPRGQLVDHAGDRDRDRARLFVPLVGDLVAAQCRHCRRGLWLRFTEHGIVHLWSGAPTFGRITD